MRSVTPVTLLAIISVILTQKREKTVNLSDNFNIFITDQRNQSPFQGQKYAAI